MIPIILLEDDDIRSLKAGEHIIINIGPTPIKLGFASIRTKKLKSSFDCEICKKSFSSKMGLGVHRATHKKEK